MRAGASRQNYCARGIARPATVRQAEWRKGDTTDGDTRRACCSSVRRTQDSSHNLRERKERRENRRLETGPQGNAWLYFRRARSMRRSPDGSSRCAADACAAFPCEAAGEAGRAAPPNIAASLTPPCACVDGYPVMSSQALRTSPRLPEELEFLQGEQQASCSLPDRLRTSMHRRQTWWRCTATHPSPLCLQLLHPAHLWLPNPPQLLLKIRSR